MRVQIFFSVMTVFLFFVAKIKMEFELRRLINPAKMISIIGLIVSNMVYYNEYSLCFTFATIGFIAASLDFDNKKEKYFCIIVSFSMVMLFYFLGPTLLEKRGV